MPTYQYACTECGHAFEQFQSFTDDALTECPECAGRLRKLFNAVGVVFKGSGFYRNDSRPTSKTSDASDSSDSSTSDSPSSTSSTSSTNGDSGSKGDAGTKTPPAKTPAASPSGTSSGSGSAAS
ncbi:MAG: FmdB family zinc ribbon protein [Nocardioides sp.]